MPSNQWRKGKFCNAQGKVLSDQFVNAYSLYLPDALSCSRISTLPCTDPPMVSSHLPYHARMATSHSGKRSTSSVVASSKDLPASCLSFHSLVQTFSRNHDTSASSFKILR